jgi:hypothetical protein
MKREQQINICQYIQDNVRHFVDSHDINRTTLCGACAIASYVLYNVFRQLKVLVVFVEASREDALGYKACHCWVETPHYVYDITATQFNKRKSATWPTVLVMKRRDYYTIKLFQYDEIVKGPEALNNVSRWGCGQSPNHYPNDTQRLIKAVVAMYKQNQF